MNVKTGITAIVALAWFGTYVAKSVNPALDMGGMAPDALMTTVVGWWLNEKRKEANAEEEE